jgi:hypothetical protein
LFDKLETIRLAVADVDGIEYTSNNIHDEITDYPAYQVEDNVEVDLLKIAVNGQIYNATMRFNFWVHTNFDDYTDEETLTLFEEVFKAIAATTGVNYITVTKGRRTFWQMGSYKTRSITATVEILTKESWV